MIKKACECSVRQFMKALFEDDRSEFENFELIWAEYVDLSGLCETREKDLMAAIHNIDIRQKVIPGMSKFEMSYLEEFGKPYLDAFWIFKKFGHRLKWNDDKEDFLRQLEFMRLKELTHESVRDKLEKELADLRKVGIKIDGNGRKEFIKLLNDIGKQRRNDVDRDKTDVETFALMVKDFLEKPAK